MARLTPIDRQGNLDPQHSTYLMISMTKRCNLRCPGCYYLQQDDDFFKNQDISLGNAKQIVNYYHSKGVNQVIPNAEGDVLLHPEYSDFVNYINSKGFRRKPWLVTNGIRLPEYAEFAVRNSGEILISIDGSTAEKYNAFRGGNEALFRKVIKGLRSVVDAAKKLDNPTEIIINCVMTADRCHDIPAMIRFAEETGVNTIKFTNYHVANNSDAVKPLYQGDPDINLILSNVMKKNDYSVNIFLPSLYGRIAPPFLCKMLASIMIGSNGDYAPCCRIIPDSKWGNFHTTPEKHNNQALKDFRLSVHNAKNQDELPQICQKCAHLSPNRPVYLVQKAGWFMTAAS